MTSKYRTRQPGSSPGPSFPFPGESEPANQGVVEYPPEDLSLPAHTRDTMVGQPSPPAPRSDGQEMKTLLAPDGHFEATRFHNTDAALAQLEGNRGDGPRLRLVAGRMIPGTRYRIVRWLGEGGMGVVYEVENIDIEKNFALKVLRFDLSQQEYIANIFRDEARAASRIGSPYIVDINNFGELSDGRLYFCMEMLDGHDLTPDPENPILPLPEFLGHLRQICKGLGAAHHAGIIHRDIKPENIFVYTQEGRERIKLLDFGISAMGGGASASGGTPHYMAPEQILALDFDGRLDIYALGCTAFELLTGQTPFDHEDPEQLFAQHLELPVPRFSEINPDHTVPEPVEAVILKCLAKQPQDRYANMAELEAALCEAQIEANILTPWDDLPLPELDAERMESLARRMPSANRYGARRRWMWPAIAGMSTMVAAGLAYALSERPATDQEREQIEALVARAQNAGARTWYVYPPETNPKAETSYLAVLELEGLEGPMKSLGETKAKELRKQFADTLSRVGDRYWEVRGARSFARDFYTQAIFFDPDAKIANTRAGITPGQMTELRSQAAKRKFSARMLASLQIVNDMADPDLTRRAAKLRRRQRSKKRSAVSHGLLAEALNVSDKVKALPSAPKLSDHPSVLTKKQLAAMEERELGQREATPIEEKVAQVSPPPRRDPKPVISNRTQIRPGKAAKKRRNVREPEPPRESHAPRSKRDRRKSNEYFTKAQFEHRRGHRSQAERLYNLALAHNSRNHRALNGLSELYFDMGRYEKSVKNAASAVRLAPKKSAYHLQYGDALYKVRRYLEARDAYYKAKSTGSTGADRRLRNIADKIGM